MQDAERHGARARGGPDERPQAVRHRGSPSRCQMRGEGSRGRAWVPVDLGGVPVGCGAPLPRPESAPGPQSKHATPTARPPMHAACHTGQSRVKTLRRRHRRHRAAPAPCRPATRVRPNTSPRPWRTTARALVRAPRGRARGRRSAGGRWAGCTTRPPAAAHTPDLPTPARSTGTRALPSTLSPAHRPKKGRHDGAQPAVVLQGRGPGAGPHP
jgi:hypothetical protein